MWIILKKTLHRPSSPTNKSMWLLLQKNTKNKNAITAQNYLPDLPRKMLSATLCPGNSTELYIFLNACLISDSILISRDYFNLISQRWEVLKSNIPGTKFYISEREL